MWVLRCRSGADHPHRCIYTTRSHHGDLTQTIIPTPPSSIDSTPNPVVSVTPPTSTSQCCFDKPTIISFTPASVVNTVTKFPLISILSSPSTHLVKHYVESHYNRTSTNDILYRVLPLYPSLILSTRRS